MKTVNKGLLKTFTKGMIIDPVILEKRTTDDGKRRTVKYSTETARAEYLSGQDTEHARKLEDEYLERIDRMKDYLRNQGYEFTGNEYQGNVSDKYDEINASNRKLARVSLSSLKSKATPSSKIKADLIRQQDVQIKRLERDMYNMEQQGYKFKEGLYGLKQVKATAEELTEEGFQPERLKRKYSLLQASNTDDSVRQIRRRLDFLKSVKKDDLYKYVKGFEHTDPVTGEEVKFRGKDAAAKGQATLRKERKKYGKIVTSETEVKKRLERDGIEKALEDASSHDIVTWSWDYDGYTTFEEGVLSGDQFDKRNVSHLINMLSGAYELRKKNISYEEDQEIVSLLRVIDNYGVGERTFEENYQKIYQIIYREEMPADIIPSTEGISGLDEILQRDKVKRISTERK